MASIGDILSNPLIAFIIGLIPSFITIGLVIVKYYLSKRRSREESVLPYLRKLYGNISKILEQRDAKDLRNQYYDWLNTKITQKMFDNSRQQVMEEEKINYPHNVDNTLSPSSIKEVLFIHSYNAFEELVAECKNFEKIYEEMETEGLFNTLKVRYRRLYQRMYNFHLFVEATMKDDKQETVKVGKIMNMTDFHNNYPNASLNQLLRWNSVVDNIFSYGSELEKELRNFL